jgi:DNA-binding CsgD family transcriptional regulator
VSYLRFVLVVVNSVAFLALMIMSIRFGNREEYLWVRRLWNIIALTCGALVLGSIQRLAIQGAAVGWVPEAIGEAATSDIQLAQSLVVLSLVVLAFLTVKKLADSMDGSKRLTATLLDRVRHIDPQTLGLTRREREVLALIGEGVTTDSGLATELHISTSTVHSHIKSLYKKAGLHNRTDLVALSVLIETSDTGS